MSWYSLRLSCAQVASGRASQCKDSFEEAFAAARGPRSMAVFQRECDEGGLDLFFTPECGTYAEELLDAWGCTPCERPSMIGLHLLVGHNEITYYMP